MLSVLFFAALPLLAHASALLPAKPIRGVNLGGWFVVEPWMMTPEWNNMGCGAWKSEFDCMSNVAGAQSAFEQHWKTWITQSDMQQIASYGLNTVRIPVGYWIIESTVYRDSEHFPTGGLAYLKQGCAWARDAGLNVIIDLHGAPGAQKAKEPFTGQYAPTAGFYGQDYQFQRAYDWAQAMTKMIHTDDSFSTVFALEVLNEPVQSSSDAGLLNDYYPGVFNAIRNTESQLGISCGGTNSKRAAGRRLGARAYKDCLNIMFMDSLWGAGDPKSNLPNTNHVVYDDHQYVKYAPGVKSQTRSGYLSFSCHDNRAAQSDSPVIVGEWSLSPQGDNANPEFDTNASGAQQFYQNWFAAQVMQYEKVGGWVFWTWKQQLNDYRWGYQQAVQNGIIPSDLSKINRNACNGY